ncbi:MAG: Undecaprenyl-phosphate 4-deoxy-4-formamido-L-arabinose transferase [Syntrophaceae bacterium PtaB.Bin038]|jgi:glycosyltransferase involved in cell wall biosynthesis|nr:MAG: Undecaprenyl-phosphate 4-deoxy-4-formamido-L-arabinose transferase [Syntrophaceae bacterium PtaB.Bin038]
MEPGPLTAAPESPVEISIILPAFQEEQGIAPLLDRIGAVMEPLGRPWEVLVIDDGSTDETAARARERGARVISHPYNIGNGAAVKTGIRQARGRVIVMMDADGQHDPADIPRLLEHVGTHDMVVGARTKESQTSLHRDLANKVYNGLASYVCNRRIEDLTSGFRAIRADAARAFLYLLPNTYSYPTTLTLSIVRSGRSLKYVPIRTSRRLGRSKIKLLRDGVRFFMIILKIATLFSPMKVFLPVSALMFLTGLFYGLARIFLMGDRYGPTSAMLMTMAVVVFMVGLVSEQVAQLRFDRAESLEPPCVK